MRYKFRNWNRALHTLSQIYPHSNWNSNLNTKLRLEFQVEYGLKLEFQVELLIRRESVYRHILRFKSHMLFPQTPWFHTLVRVLPESILFLNWITTVRHFTRFNTLNITKLWVSERTLLHIVWVQTKDFSQLVSLVIISSSFACKVSVTGSNNFHEKYITTFLTNIFQGQSIILKFLQ